MAGSRAVTFGELLRQLRRDARLTQENLAAKAGIAARTISDLERGIARTPHADTVLRLARGLALEGALRQALEAAARGRSPASGIPAARATDGAAATRTLPRDTGSFIGRPLELARLTGGAAGTGAVAGIHVIGGMAGVGKTALAVHVAHQLANRYPDGQIFVPLHGHTPGQRPVVPADTLASLLLTAGVEAVQIPPDLDGRTRLWRDRLAGKRLLLVLDDAASSDQIRPLLPGTAGCLVLVTSRRHLTALDDAHAVSLGTLAPPEAAMLLVRLAGRAGLEPGDPAVTRVAALCGYLPLAVGLLGRQLHHHPAWTPAGLAAELTAARDRLELMRAENLSVAAAFGLSYADLTEDQQRLFRRLGLHPGTDMDAWAAAALGNSGLAVTRRHLQALYDQHLITEPTPGRYQMHDLIREHARALAAADPPPDQDTARSRLLDYYQHTAALAETLLGRRSRPRPALANLVAPSAAIPGLPDPMRALSWTRAERGSLLACLDYAARTGQDARVVALTAAIAALLQQDGPWAEAITRHAAAVQAARRLGDQQGQAGALSDLGIVRRMTGDNTVGDRELQEALGIYCQLGDRQGQANTLTVLGTALQLAGDYPDAIEKLETALGVYCDLGDRQGQASALDELGVVQWMTCHYPDAAQKLEEALRIYSDLGDQPGQAKVLSELAGLRLQTGKYQGTAEMLETALSICRDLGDRRGQASALGQLGAVRRLAGDYCGAAEKHEEALGIYCDLGDQLGQAHARYGLGVVRRQTGDYREAAWELKAALGIFRGLGDRGAQATVLNETGTLYRVTGDVDGAVPCHRQALRLAREIGSSWDEAHAQAGLGRCALAAGRAAVAKARLQEARETFQRIGATEAAQVTAEIGTLIETGHTP